MIKKLWIPSEVFDAAMKLQKFFDENGIDDWCVNGVCSRRAFEKLQESSGNYGVRLKDVTPKATASVTEK